MLQTLAITNCFLGNTGWRIRAYESCVKSSKTPSSIDCFSTIVFVLRDDDESKGIAWELAFAPFVDS